MRTARTHRGRAGQRPAPRRWWRREDALASAEYVATIVLVAAVVGALLAVATPIRERIVTTGHAAVCRLFGGGCELPLAGDGSEVDTGTTSTTTDPVTLLRDLPGLAPDERDRLLAGLDPGVATALRSAARSASTDPSADPAARAGATHLFLHDEAERLASDPDVADLVLWERHREASEIVTDPHADEDARAEALDVLVETERAVADAPDGSLLAGLRDTEGGVDVWATDEEIASWHDILERRERAEHAADLAPRLRAWADSDRTFLHAEVDLDDGTVRLAELVHGDLATATDVAITIPGTGNDASTFDGSVAGDARELATTLDVLGEDDTAVVACLCYAPPPNLGHAARSGHADRGGPDLARIIGGLPVAEGAAVRAFGHSYGSTALGRAVERHELELAATVSLGGPGFGSGVNEVEDLPTSAGEVWAVRHDQDPIALAAMHGVNPDRDRFGARGFTVGDGDLERSWWRPYRFDAHGLYYRDAESLRNLALLASGRGDEVSGYREGRR